MGSDGARRTSEAATRPSGEQGPGVFPIVVNRIPFFMRKELRNPISVKDLKPKLDYPKRSTSQLKTGLDS